MDPSRNHQLIGQGNWVSPYQNQSIYPDIIFIYLSPSPYLSLQIFKSSYLSIFCLFPFFSSFQAVWKGWDGILEFPMLSSMESRLSLTGHVSLHPSIYLSGFLSFLLLLTRAKDVPEIEKNIYIYNSSPTQLIF